MDINRSIAEDILEDGATSVAEAVRWSGVGRTRLYAAMADGSLVFIQKGGRRLIPRRALRQFLAADLVNHRPCLNSNAA